MIKLREKLISAACVCAIVMVLVRLPLRTQDDKGLVV